MKEGGGRAVVLVVDDDLDHLIMLEAVLGAIGYEVVTAASYVHARRALEERFFDAVVADLTLGDGTALDLLTGLPVAHRPGVALVLSGFDRREDIDRTFEAGFDAHLVKPIGIDELRSALEGAMRR